MGVIARHRSAISEPVPLWEWRRKWANPVVVDVENCLNRSGMPWRTCRGRMPANIHGQYFDLDFVAGLCLLSLRGSTAGVAERGSRALARVLPLALDFLEIPEEVTFFGLGFLVVRFLVFDCAFFKDFNVPLMPA